MKRRRFIVASGATILSSSTFISSNKSTLGLEFNLDGTPNRDPKDVNSILVEFSKFNVTPQYINSSNSAKITVKVSIEDSHSKKQSHTINLSNGIQKDIKDNFNPMTIDDIDITDKNVISGHVSITVDHPDITDNYIQKFSISSISLIDDFTDGDLVTSANNWNGWNGDTEDLSVSGEIGTLTNSGDLSRITSTIQSSDVITDLSMLARFDTNSGSGSAAIRGSETNRDNESPILIEFVRDTGTIQVRDGYGRQDTEVQYNTGSQYEFRCTNINYQDWTFQLEIIEDGTTIHKGEYGMRFAVDSLEQIKVETFSNNSDGAKLHIDRVQGNINEQPDTYIPPNSWDWFRMSKGTGDVLKNWRRQSAGGRRGNINGASWVSGDYTDGWALSSDGSSDYVSTWDLGDWGSNLTSGWAVAFTVKTTDSSNAFIGNVSGPSFDIGMNRYLASEGQLRLLVQDDNDNTVFVNGDIVNDGNKHRIVAIGKGSDPSNWELWVDDSENSTVQADQGLNTISNFTSDLTFFARRTANEVEQYCNCTLDNIIFSHEPWSETDVQNDYDQQPWT